MKKIYWILAVLIIIGGAALLVLDHSSSPSGSTPAPVSAVPVSFTTLAQGSQSKIDYRVNYLIVNQNQLSELWTFLKQPPPAPQVDFNTNVVAAIFAGEVPTGGYSIAVAAVEDATKRIVKVNITKPGQNCVLTQSTNAPYQVVEVPKTSLPFTHADVWATTTCP
jgi:hypothetical protein